MFFFLLCRAAAHTKLNENEKAIVDCEKALSIDANYSKAYGRMGCIIFFFTMFHCFLVLEYLFIKKLEVNFMLGFYLGDKFSL